jgi:hypothetical protein
MSSLTNYRGLQVFPSDAPPPGAGGLAISDNFTDLVDWHPLSKWAQTGNPTASNDNTENYFPGSLWLNSSTNELFLCMSSATGAAVWQQVILAPINQSTGYTNFADSSGVAVGSACMAAFYGERFTASGSAITLPDAPFFDIPSVGDNVTFLSSSGIIFKTTITVVTDGQHFSVASAPSFSAGFVAVVLTSNSNAGSLAIGSTSLATGWGLAVGSNCVADGMGGSVALGAFSRASGSNAFAFGGSSIASGNYSFAGGGLGPTVSSGNYSFAFGVGSTASGFGSVAFGLSCDAMGSGAFAFGGVATASGNYSFAGGGGIQPVTASGNYAFAFGAGTTAGGGYALAGGHGSKAAGICAFAFGMQCSASGTYTTSAGAYANADNFGQVAYAAGQFANAGDAQRSNYVLRNSTSGATATNLFLDGKSAVLVLTTNQTTWGYTVYVSAYDSTDNYAGRWKIEGCVKRDNNGNVTMVGTPAVTSWVDSGFSGSATCVADNTAKALQVQVTGVASKTIRWAAHAKVEQVSFGKP